ncbi:MAG: TM2 domain-containing protein [Patescibacteria group bacterium]
MKSTRSRLVTFLLALFFGVFGVHRLYTGHVLLAVLYLCSGGVFLLGVIYDILLLIFGNYRDIEGKIV